MSDPKVTKGEVDAGFKAAREMLDATVYGGLMPDDSLREAVTRVLFAAAAVRHTSS